MKEEVSAEDRVREIRRKTRKKYWSEDNPGECVSVLRSPSPGGKFPRGNHERPDSTDR